VVFKFGGASVKDRRIKTYMFYKVGYEDVLLVVAPGKTTNAEVVVKIISQVGCITIFCTKIKKYHNQILNGSVCDENHVFQIPVFRLYITI
jgi:uncharacterized membrane protein